MKDLLSSEKKVSIIVPVYNAQRYLNDTLSDLVKQTYQNIEIIVIDDGSTDGSKEIIKEFARKDKRVIGRYINNGGPSRARNIGLDIANGEYIRFVDADDRIPKDSIRCMVNAYYKHTDVDLVIGNYKCIPSKEYFVGNSFKNEVVTQEEFANRFVSYVRSFYFGVPWNKLYKRKLIEANHIRFNEDILWSEDFIFNISYYDSCKKMFFLYMAGGVYKYYDRSGSITSSLNSQDKNYMDKINNFRYEKGVSYFRKYGKDKEFQLEWKYNNLYARLSVIAKNAEYGSIKERYQVFSEIIMNNEVYEYICEKCINSKLKIWWILKKAIVTKKCWMPFSFFVGKGFIVQIFKVKKRKKKETNF